MTRVLLAGATGAVGTRLTTLLVAAGHEVFGTTRFAAKAESLRAAGAHPVVVDALDEAALARAVAAARPAIVIHQLTDLPPGLDPAGMPDALVRNARLRREGTRNLVAAALAAGVRRLIAQSIAWAYAPGPEPHREEDPLDLAAAGARGASVGAVAELERLTLASPPLEGIVLRYGNLWGPGTGRERPCRRRCARGAARARSRCARRLQRRRGQRLRFERQGAARPRLGSGVPLAGVMAFARLAAQGPRRHFGTRPLIAFARAA